MIPLIMVRSAPSLRSFLIIWNSMVQIDGFKRVMHFLVNFYQRFMQFNNNLLI